MYLKCLFVIGCQFLSLIRAEIVPCHVFADENRNLSPLQHDDWIRVDYCDSLIEKCCVRGCCKKDNNDSKYVWFIVLFISSGITILCYGCCKKCYHLASKDATATRDTNRDDGENENLTSGLGSSDNSQIRIVPRQSEPSFASEDDDHSATPPPSYEMAVVMPSASAAPHNSPLLRSENSVSSFEDVQTGRRK